jgi:glucose-1-phosphatase
MESRKYSVIVFDLGKVLLDFDYGILTAKLDKVENGLGEKFTDFYKQHRHEYRDFESARISEKEFLKRVLAALDHKVDAETFCQMFGDIFTPNEDVVSLLPIFKKKYTLILLSNTNDIHRRYGWQKYDFIKQFDHLVLSHEAGIVKPEEEIYKLVEDFTHKPAEEHLFIDDTSVNTDEAITLGWDAINFVGYANLVSELKNRAIL